MLKQIRESYSGGTWAFLGASIGDAIFGNPEFARHEFGLMLVCLVLWAVCVAIGDLDSGNSPKRPLAM